MTLNEKLKEFELFLNESIKRESPFTRPREGYTFVSGAEDRLKAYQIVLEEFYRLFPKTQE